MRLFLSLELLSGRLDREERIFIPHQKSIRQIDWDEVKPIVCFQKRPKDGADSVLCSNMSTGLVDIYEVKRCQRHLLAAIESNRLGGPIQTINIKRIGKI